MAALPPLPLPSAFPTSKASSFHPFPFPSNRTTVRLLLPRRSPLSATTPTSFPYSFQSPFRRYQHQKPLLDEEEENDEEQLVSGVNEDLPIGDCLVFEEGAFEDGDPFHPPEQEEEENRRPSRRRKSPPSSSAAVAVAAVKPENLVPDKWREAVAEINLTKKEKRKIVLELKHGSKVERRRNVPVMQSPEYLAFREMKLSQLNPVVLDEPAELPPPRQEDDGDDADAGSFSSSERAVPRNPRVGIAGESLETISEFFNSGVYVPEEDFDDKKPKGSRKLFTKEEKILLNKRVPYLEDATSTKWLPLHTLAASGDFYLMDMLLKHDVDINATDADGLCAIHKAILGKKQAILNYLLRESANPFVRDNDGATLMHYAVQTASSQAIKTLLLYNVDINLPDDDGWTPLHLAVQTQRTDIVKLLLLKGADKTLRNKDGSTPLDLCLYLGKSERTYEIINLLKSLPKFK